MLEIRGLIKDNKHMGIKKYEKLREILLFLECMEVVNIEMLIHQNILYNEIFKIAVHGEYIRMFKAIDIDNKEILLFIRHLKACEFREFENNDKLYWKYSKTKIIEVKNKITKEFEEKEVADIKDFKFLDRNDLKNILNGNLKHFQNIQKINDIKDIAEIIDIGIIEKLLWQVQQKRGSF